MTEAADEWTRWVRQHGPALVLLARQWAPDIADAEDIFQEGFVRFWRARARAQDPVAFLYACIKRYALEWLRGRHRRLQRDEAAARAELVSHSWFAESLVQDERRTVIESAMRRLPEEQREVLVMKICGGLSFPQIAESLIISANTAASRYRYALAKLREQHAEESIR
jgi:RNA polymerase sigma-70 factor (ECF subfamily)